MNWFLAAVLALIATGAMAWSGEFEHGQSDSATPGSETAFETWMPLARQGDRVAQFHIAEMYFFGGLVAQDKSEAARWYLASAKQGVPAAQRALGHMHAKGDGVPRDLLKGAQWSNRAAKNGDRKGAALLATVQADLGWAYLGGQLGLEQDTGLACMWFTIAGENNNAYAAGMAARLCREPEAMRGDENLEALKTRCEASGYFDCD